MGMFTAVAVTSAILFLAWAVGNREKGQQQ